MKKIYSSFFLIVSLPFTLVRKIKNVKLNNFIAGLVFGAVFSLIINVLTVQIQETIQKQRILEAVETEIFYNILIAEGVITENQEKIKNGEKPSFFSSIRRYTRDLWEQSSDPLKYLVQLDGDVQASVIVFYNSAIPAQNQMLDKLEALERDKMSNCYRLQITPLTQDEEDSCTSWHMVLLNSEVSTAVGLRDSALEVLKKFHPTQDRLRNPFLRFLIGGKSTRALSGY